MKVKSKAIPSSSKSVAKTVTTKVREKKVFSLAGQKHDPPEEVLLLIFLQGAIMPFLVSACERCFLVNEMAVLLLVLQREPLRIFYESLSKQIPTSEMAEFWYVSSISCYRKLIHFLFSMFER